MSRRNAVARIPAAKVAVVPQRPIRALPIFEALPYGHMTFLVTGDGAEPHLKPGEYAVIDLTDRKPTHGELYLIQSSFGERRRYIQMAKRDFMAVSPSGIPEKVWWLSDMRGFRRVELSDGLTIFGGLSDGPMKKKGIKKSIAGRVVGYAEWQLGNELEQCAGYDE